MLDVTPVRDSPKAAFDVAMPLEAVRAIASAPRTNLVRIGRNDSSCVVAFGREDTPGTTYAPCKTWNVRTYDRIISEEPVYAATAEMPRVEALDALRATTPNEDEDNPNGICRFEIARTTVCACGRRRATQRPKRPHREGSSPTKSRDSKSRSSSACATGTCSRRYGR